VGTPAAGDKRVALAAVAGAHGIKGEVRLKLFADSADSLKAHERLFIGGAERKLLSLNAAGKAPIARFEGISDRTQAEGLRGSLVEVERSALPPLGEVASVENFGAGDLLEVRLADGRLSLIPFRPGISDLEGDQVVLDPEFLA
jgi:16S rRNA processing protein RimM